MYDEPRKKGGRQRAMLVGVRHNQQDEREAQEYLDELRALVETFGAQVVDTELVKISKPQPRLLIGSGNAESIVAACKEQQITLIVFDEELSPSQQRNWESISKLTVIDRQEVILDIFAKRASTREAVLQIELAQTEYMLPRMKRAWTHLQRQEGRVGVRGGEGEKQIEIDSRLLRKRIAKLKEELKDIRRQRAEQRKKRRARPVPNAAIVGYTNAGKSSLFNLLTDSSVLVEDKLFATLDPTTRRFRLPNNQVLLLTDTVGFVRKLPHDLVESFKATLEEAVIADYLIHVVDASSTAAVDQYETTCRVLDEIGAGNKRTITVFNKIDLIEHKYQVNRLRRRYPEALFISVAEKTGIELVVQAAQSLLAEDMSEMFLCFPPDKYDLVAWLHRTSQVISEKHEGDAIYVKASVPDDFATNILAYVVEGEPTETE